MPLTSISGPTRYLEVINEHPSDKEITFQEEGHIYTIEGFEGAPTSVTTLIHHCFPQFDADVVIDKMMKGRNWKSSKYYGKTKQQIKDTWEAAAKEASTLGTAMHEDIERFLNNETVLDPGSLEHGYFQDFWKDFQTINGGFKPYRTEWLVFDKDRGIAGSIDCVLRDENGNLCILDWKRSKEIKMQNKFEKGLPPFSDLENTNFWHYSLQLNIYRHILETKYNQNVVGMCIVVFHPNNPKYQVHSIAPYDIASKWLQITEPHLHKKDKDQHQLKEHD